MNGRRVTLYVSDKDYVVWDRARLEAEALGMSMSAYVAFLLGKKRLVVEDREDQ